MKRKKINIKGLEYDSIMDLINVAVQGMEIGRVIQIRVKMLKNPGHVLPASFMKYLYTEVLKKDKGYQEELYHFRGKELIVSPKIKHKNCIEVKIPNTTEYRDIPITELNRNFGILLFKY